MAGRAAWLRVLSDSTIGPSRFRVAADRLDIRDCSRRGEIVLDPFGGSGSTLIAAEKTGRGARLVEFDPIYCDQIMQRFEQVTGKAAVLAATRDSFETVSEQRAAMIEPSVGSVR